MCDPHYKNKKNFLFLQTILSAKKYLYISYIGNSIDNSTGQYPSELGEIIINYITNNFCLVGEENLDLKTIKKNILLYLCQLHEDIYYTTSHCVQKNINNNKNIYHLEKTNFIRSLIPMHIDVINFSQLIYFWKRPVHSFFNNRLKIKLISKNNNINKSIIVDSLNRYKFNIDILHAMINNNNIFNVFKYYCNIGVIPHNSLGYTYFEKQRIEITSLFNKISYIKKYRIIKKHFYIPIKKYFLSGTLETIHNIGIVRWKPKNINIYDILLLWLEHLIYCYLGGQNNSKIIGLKNSEWQFKNLKKELAKYYINQYLSGYIKGLNKPILLIKSGINWFNIVYDKKNKNIIKNQHIEKKGIKKFLDTWYGNQYHTGEKDDIYLNKIIPILNQDIMTEICNTTQYWLLPLFNNKIKK
ncbi:MAG TPA: hypothetical protein VK482_01065 [Buchnera sp. (in: enterobacteria)]|nr:hypothetical protein [Buchnera sp. (in: enterobacteria)]